MDDPHTLLRRLAEPEPGEPPVVSVYLDMRLHATGENSAVRSGLIVLKDRLREIENSLPRALLPSSGAAPPRVLRSMVTVRA